MNNTSKLLMIILMVVTAVIVAQLIDHPPGENRVVDRDNIMGKNSLDLFVSESYSYEDRLLFVYTPRNPDSKFDCYVTYEFKEDGDTLESANKKFYGNVSVENPIVFEYPKKKDSTYELEIKIEDKSGINLHKSKIKISPAAVESEAN